jgi:sugar lactone lactonase YvrE
MKSYPPCGDARLRIVLLLVLSLVLNACGGGDGSDDPFVAPDAFLRGIALDGGTGRALVVDSGADSVVAVDLVTGARTVLSDDSTPDADNAFSEPRGIALDSANARALVVDEGLAAVVAVDLITGARTVLSDGSTPDADNAFGEPRGIALDSANARALVVDEALTAVVAVDLVTGARTILSDSSTPDANNPLRDPFGITVNSANGRALVTSKSPFDIFELTAVVVVDLATGARTILSNSSTPDVANAFRFASSIALDSANGRALVVDGGGLFFPDPTVVAVDLVTGARTIVASGF